MAAGKDPAREKQRDKVRAKLEADNTFAAITAEFCEKRRRDGSKTCAASTVKRCEYLLSLLSGSIDRLPTTDIEPIDVLEAVRRIDRQRAPVRSNPNDHTPPYASPHVRALSESS